MISLNNISVKSLNHASTLWTNLQVEVLEKREEYTGIQSSVIGDCCDYTGGGCCDYCEFSCCDLICCDLCCDWCTNACCDIDCCDLDCCDVGCCDYYIGCCDLCCDYGSYA